MSIEKDFCIETFDDKGMLVDFDIRYPDNYNFGYDVVDRIAGEDPQKTALVWCNTEGKERIFSFEEISSLSNKAANAFLSHGIRKGDKVMVVLKRHYEYWYVSVALHKIGAILIPVTHMLTPEDMAYRINGAKIKGVVATPDNEVPEKLMEAKNLCNSEPVFWSVQKELDGFFNLTKEVEEASSQLKRLPTLAHEPMLMYFTSGTTGYPKGVIHDHTYTLAHILTAKYWQQVIDGGLHFTVSETGWGKTSWGKIYGQWLCGSAVMVFDFDNFDPRQLMTVINHYKVTTFCAPPTVYRYLVKKGIVKMPSLVHASTAGEALNPEVFRSFQEKTGLTLMEGYGQTESTLILGNIRGSVSRPGSMGKPTPLYHVDLYNDEGKPTVPGEIGEIVILPPQGKKQPGIFVAYHDNEALYRPCLGRRGLSYRGYRLPDEDGYYWFNGRIDDVIKTGGFRVGPFEIENVLMEHAAVMECSVVGVPDPLRGQAIKAIVVLAPGYEPSLELQKEIKEFCNKKVAEYKWIRSIEFVSAMPKTISGKIRKVEQRQE